MSTTTPAWRPLAAHLLAATLLATTAVIAAPTPAHAQPTGVRLVADGPVETAVLLSAHTFPEGADEVLIGTADAFPDNLASGVLQVGRPLLLTDPDGLDQAVAEEITRLGATSATVLGGEAAVAADVVDDLEDLGLDTTRLEGPTRIETAVAVAEETGATRVVLARAFPSDGAGDPSQAFADSLAAGALAADLGTPVLLTQTDVLTGSTAEHLADAGVDDVVVVGGPAAVGPAVEEALEGPASGDLSVTRIQGATRFETAVAVAEARDLDPAATTAVVLTEGQAGDAWVAGFAAAAGAAATDAPVLLSNGEDLPDPTAELLQAIADDSPGASLVCTPSADAAACDAAAAILGVTTSDVTLDDLLVDGPAGLTGAPELLSAAIVGGDATTTTIDLTFDEPVVVVEPSRIIVGSPWPDVDELASATGALPGLGDPSQIRVEVPAAEALRARLSTVYLFAGAVQDEDAVENVPATAGLQDVTYTPGRTDGPDLIDVVFDPGATPDGDGDETVDFVFDAPVTVAGSSQFFRVIPGTGQGLSPFTITQPAETVIRGAYVTGALSDEVWADVRRVTASTGAVADLDGRLNAPFDLEVGPPSGAPDLVSVVTDTQELTATFTFDEPVTIVNPDEFFLIDVQGGTIGGPGGLVDTQQGGPAEVIVRFASTEEVHQGIVAGHIRASAVMDAGGTTSRRDTLAVSTLSYPAGTTAGPVAVAAERTGGAEDPAIEVVISYDVAVGVGNEPIAYDLAGTPTPFPAGSCAGGPTPQQLTCTVAAGDPEFAAVADAVALGLQLSAQGAITNLGSPPIMLAIDG